MIDMIKNKNQLKEKAKCDVTISIGKSINSRRITFIFQSRARKKVFKTLSYAVFGFVKNDYCERCYFNTSDKYDGFKITARNNETAYFGTRIDERFSNIDVDKWNGHYNLSFDEKEKMWYIQLEKAENEE